MTVADHGVPELPLPKMLVWLLVAAAVYAALALVGVGLGYLIEMLLGWLP